MKRLFNVVVWTLILGVSALAQAQSPRITFSDLQSGPNSGGPNNKGAIVTVYGFGFGASRGTSSVTIGGAPADNYLQWSDTRISFQPGSSAISGNILVNVAGAGSSNGAPYTVRSGRIFFVSPQGNDANAGTFTAPWHSVVKAKDAAAAGDIIYLMNGVNESGLENSSASVALAKSGTSTLPIALVAYPGATATIGSATGQQYGIRTTSTSNYWILAGLTLRGSFSALNVANSSNWRVIANDISCPNGFGSGACADFAGVANIKAYHNLVHDVGSLTSTSLKLYQGVQFEAGSHGIDFGWNEIANVRSCRALQFYSDTGTLYNISVDNNLIHDSRCDGINFATVDPALGSVKAYNNVVYRAGTGPAPGGLESNYACINVGAAGSAAVVLQNNTLYDCGARANNDSGAVSASAPVSMTDNIVVSTTGETYLAPNSLTTLFSGSNNLFFGAGAAPAFSSASLNADPMFVGAANANFRLQTSSPAIGHGANTGISRDIVQVLRPTAYDMGAYEHTSTVVPPPPPQQGTLNVAPPSVAFGNVVTGSSASQTVTISNISTAAVTISSLSVSGTGFSQSGATLPLTLAGGQSAAVSVNFAPLAAGSVSGSLQINNNATNGTIWIPLSGTGTTTTPQQGTLSVAPPSVAFGNVVTGSTANQTVTITNFSTFAVTVSSLSVSGAGFSQSGATLPLTLAGGQSAAVSVKFAPLAAGSVSGSLQINNNATNGTIWIPLSGAGTTTPPQQGTLTVNPLSLAFGKVLIGSSTSQTITLSNSSSVAVTVSNLSATGTGFSQSGLATPFTLNPGQTATLKAAFAPQTAGAASGSVQITSNASNGSAAVALSGSGSTVQHSVDVSWGVSNPPASGYNVYRSTQSGGPYTRLNPAPITALLFTDNTVSSGVTYFYVVTSVAADGTESGDSNQATAVVPNP